MKKWIVAAVVVIFAAAGFAFASQGSWGPGWGHGFHSPMGHSMGRRILALLDNSHFRAEVKLTDTQVSHLRQIVTRAEKSNIETRAQIEVDGIDLHQLLRAAKPDQAMVMKKVQEISQLRGQMMKNNIQALLQAKTVLTPEQQEKIRQFFQNRFMEHGWKRHWRGNWGQNWREKNWRRPHHRGGMMMRTPGTPPSTPTPPSPPNQQY